MNKGIKKAWAREELNSDLYDGVFVSTTAGSNVENNQMMFYRKFSN